MPARRRDAQVPDPLISPPRRRLRLRLLNEFQCAGAACPDNCCHGWRVDVDAATVQRWAGHGDAARREWLVQALEPCNGGDGSLRQLRQRTDGYCVHQDAQGLCRIQRRFGHQELPETCRTYPRVSVRREGVELDTAHLSCPAVVWLLHAQSGDGRSAFEHLEGHSDAGAQRPASVLDQVGERLQWYTGQLLAWPGPLGVRLYDLAGTLAFVQSKAAAGALDARTLADRVGVDPPAIHRRLDRIARQHACGELEPALGVRRRYWQLVRASGTVFDRQEIKTRMDRSAVAQLLATNASGHGAEVALREFVRTANQTLLARLPDAMALLERYLEVKFWNHGFPWNPFAGNYTATFLDCVLPLSQSVLITWVALDCGPDPDSAFLQTALYSVEKSVSHSTRIFDFVRQHPMLLQPETYRAALLELG